MSKHLVRVGSVALWGILAMSRTALADDGPKRPDCAVGLTDLIYASCGGCHPLEARIDERVAIANFAENIRTEVRRCLNGNLGSNISRMAIGKENFVGCIEERITLDEDIKLALIRLVDAATSDTLKADMDRVNAWNTCYSNQLLCGERSCSTPNVNDYMALLREMFSQFSLALLETYGCNWMQVGTGIANKACDGACNALSLRELYRTKMGSLSDSQRNAICAGLALATTSYADDKIWAFECGASTPWFSAHSGDVLCSGPRPSACSAGVLASSPNWVAAQIGLVRDILFRRIKPEQRAVAVEQVIKTWSEYGASDGFVKATAAWDSIVRLCAEHQCVFALLGERVNVRTATWLQVRLLMFRAWLEAFSTSRELAGDFSYGCKKGRMYLDSKTLQWLYATDGGCTPQVNAGPCLQFPPPRNANGAAARLADMYFAAPAK